MENYTCPFPHKIGIASRGPNNPGRDLHNPPTQMAAAFEGTGIQKNGINVLLGFFNFFFLVLKVLGFKFKPGGLQVALSGQWNVLFVGNHKPAEYEEFNWSKELGFHKTLPGTEGGVQPDLPQAQQFTGHWISLWKTDSLEGLS